MQCESDLSEVDRVKRGDGRAKTTWIEVVKKNFKKGGDDYR